MSDTIKTVQKITIGSESRFISAKYDINGNEISTKYGKLDTVAADGTISDAGNVYSRTQADARYGKIDITNDEGTVTTAGNVYTKTQADARFLKEHQSLENYYTKTETDATFLKEHQSLTNYYTKSEVDTKFSTTGETGNTYTKTEVNDIFLRKISLTDENGEVTEEGADNYLKIRDAESTYVQSKDLTKEITSTVTDMVTSGDLNIKVIQNKRIATLTNLFSLTCQKKNYGRHVIIKVGTSNVKSSNTGQVKFDAETGTAGIKSTFGEPGATFEIYDKFLFCRSSEGESMVFISPESMWSTLEISIDANFSVVVFDEDWEDEETGGNS